MFDVSDALKGPARALVVVVVGVFICPTDIVVIHDIAQRAFDNDTIDNLLFVMWKWSHGDHFDCIVVM